MTDQYYNSDFEDRQFSWTRVAGVSFAIAFHMAVVMFLLAPVSQPAPQEDEEEVVQVTFIEPPPPPPEPPVVFEDASPMAVEAPPPAPPAPPAPPQDYGASEDQSYRRAKPPRYPPQALRNREQGEVILRVLVDANGDPAQIEVEKSSRSRLLDRAAIDAVRLWKFNPGLKNGQPVSGWVLVPINFRLDQA